MNTNLKKIAPEADGILKDGQTIRFRQMMMDGSQPSIVATDNRPRFAVMDEAQQAASTERQKAYDARLSDAWRNPTSLFAPPAAPSPAMAAVDKLAVAATDTSAIDAIQANNQAKYNARIENAWRYPINHGARGC